MEERLHTLKTNAIKLYLREYDVGHIPVDTYERPESYDEDIDCMFNGILKDSLRESFDLSCFIDERQAIIGGDSFSFLNIIYNSLMYRFLYLKTEY